MKRLFILLIIASTSASGQILDWGADDDFSWWGDGNGTVGDFGLGYDSGTGKLTLKDTAGNALLTGTDGGTTLALSLTGSLTCSGTLSAAATAFEAAANPVLTLTRTITTGTTGGVIPLVIRGETSGDMTDGFEVLIDGEIQDNAAGPNVIARIRMGRDGADNQGDMSLQTATTGGTLTTGIHIDDDQNISMPNGNLDITGTLTCDTSATVGSTTVSPDELGYIDGLTPGTLSNSKAIVVDALGKINTMDITALSLNGTAVSATATEINRLAGVTPGTITASKVVEVDASNKVNEWTVTGSSATETGFIGQQIGPSGDANLIGLSANAVNVADGIVTITDTVSDGAVFHATAASSVTSGAKIAAVRGTYAPTLTGDSGSARYGGLFACKPPSGSVDFIVACKAEYDNTDASRDGTVGNVYVLRISRTATGSYGTVTNMTMCAVDACTLGTTINNAMQIGETGNSSCAFATAMSIAGAEADSGTGTAIGVDIGDVTGATAIALRTGDGDVILGGDVTAEADLTVDDDLVVTDDVTMTGIMDRGTWASFTANDTSPGVSTGQLFAVPATWTAGNNITSFDDGVDGQEIVVLGGDSDCTVESGTGNITIEGGNWTASAGTVGRFVYHASSAAWYGR